MTGVQTCALPIFGRLITAQFDITFPLSSSTVSVYLTGLPEETRGYNNLTGSYNSIYLGSVWHFDTGAGANNPVSSNVLQYIAFSGADPGFYVQQDAATGILGNVTYADLSNKRLIGTITYISAT